jgi:DNA-binding transcriptional MerR regulator
MTKISTSEATRILGINKQTLFRWEKSGSLPAVERKGLTEARMYDKETIEEIAMWRNLRKEEKAHLRKLGKIREKLDSYLPTKPLDAFESPRMLSHAEFLDMKKGYEDLRKWEKKLDEIQESYWSFAKDYFGKNFDE